MPLTLLVAKKYKFGLPIMCLAGMALRSNGVPAHDERDFAFASKEFDRKLLELSKTTNSTEQCYHGEGLLKNSKFWWHEYGRGPRRNRGLVWLNSNMLVEQNNL